MSTDSRPPANLVAGLSLVMPAYNEEAGIGRAVREACIALERLADRFEVLVVDDGSRDATTAAALVAGSNWPGCVRVLGYGRNRGYGAALRTGFTEARYGLVAFTDADCQFFLDDLRLLLPLVQQADIVTGYRLDRQDPWARKFFSWGYNWLVRSLLGTGVRDCDCALKVFRRNALRRILPTMSGFVVNAEMLTYARKLGMKVTEVGVRHRPRLSGASKVSLLDIPRTLRKLLPFWWAQIVLRQSVPSTPSEVISTRMSVPRRLTANERLHPVVEER